MDEIFLVQFLLHQCVSNQSLYSILTDFITYKHTKTKSDVWTQHINVTISYCTVYCTYTNFIVF